MYAQPPVRSENHQLGKQYNHQCDRIMWKT